MKHLLLSAILLLFASNLIAQLHVRPNATAGTDSYIYANDVVLYVEDDINLIVNNNNPETQASIYLRGDSQLIQGDKPSSTNTGNGSLSVWQRGWANAYDYNYWASPVGNPNDPATGNTNFGIPRIFDVREDGIGSGILHKTFSTQQQNTWEFDGVPSNVAIGDEGTLQVSRRWIYTMRALSGYGNWIFIGNQNGIGNGLAPGEGFTMKGTGTAADGATYTNAHDQLYDFRGRPNDGSIPVGVAAGQETLTGNPYPSTLDMAAFINDPANVGVIEGYARFWDQNRLINSHYIADYQGGYGVWQPGGGSSVPVEYGGGTTGTYAAAPILTYDGSGTQSGDTGTFGSVYTGRFSPPGQGFMVIGSAGTTGTATINNTMRIYVPYGAAFHNEHKSLIGSSLSATADQVPNLSSEPEYIFPTLRFHVEINELYVRDMVMILFDQTTIGADRGWDSKHPSLINDGDTFWVLENETDPFVIQSRPFDYQELIPLGLKVRNGSNSFKIKAAEMLGFENLSESHGAEIRLYLFDQLNNQYQRISTEHTAVINHNGNAGKIEDRYFIVYRRDINEDVASLKSTVVNVDFFQNNPQSKLEVSNPDVLDIKNASIYDMRGRLVLTENNIGKVARFSFPTHNLSSGVYIVKLTTRDNGIIDYKITVHNK